MENLTPNEYKKFLSSEADEIKETCTDYKELKQEVKGLKKALKDTSISKTRLQQIQHHLESYTNLLDKRITTIKSGLEHFYKLYHRSICIDDVQLNTESKEQVNKLRFNLESTLQKLKIEHDIQKSKTIDTPPPAPYDAVLKKKDECQDNDALFFTWLEEEKKKHPNMKIKLSKDSIPISGAILDSFIEEKVSSDLWSDVTIACGDTIKTVSSWVMSRSEWAKNFLVQKFEPKKKKPFEPEDKELLGKSLLSPMQKEHLISACYGNLEINQENVDDVINLETHAGDPVTTLLREYWDTHEITIDDQEDFSNVIVLCNLINSIGLISLTLLCPPP